MDFLKYSSDEKEEIEKEINQSFISFFSLVKTIAIVIILIFCIAFILTIPRKFNDVFPLLTSSQTIIKEGGQDLEENTFAPQKKITATSYMVMDISNDKIVVSKNFNKPVPIASLTKLMTAIIATENSILNLPVVFSQTGSSTNEEIFSNGEKMTIQSALYPLLMESSNQAADAIARLYTEKSFVTMMNNKARQLGMNQTSFIDSSGIGAGNVSSPGDLAILSKYLLFHHPEILAITKIPSKTITTSLGKKSIRNINLFENDPRFIGGKIGFTTEAGETMLALFKLPVPATPTIPTKNPSASLTSLDQNPDPTLANNSDTFVFIVLGSKNRARDISTFLQILEGISHKSS
jgi:D-alanyl-D-alanine carboxypeptidase